MSGVQTGRLDIDCALGDLPGQAARSIAEQARNVLPDLSEHVVLVRDPHVAGALAAELRAAAAVPVVLLPRITTLQQWAASCAVDRPVIAPAAREIALHQALAARSWLRDADMWAVAAELATLFDELTRWKVALAADPDALAQRLAEAYGATDVAALRFEARLVHELWFACARDTAALSAEQAYPLRLAKLAAGANGPLWGVGLGALAPSETQFLAQYAERAPVTMFHPRADCSRAVEDVLDCAWPRTSGPPLRERALALARRATASPLAGRLTFFGAASVEQEARVIDAAVRRWLLAGCRSIAVVIFDRVVARRARALLERAGILVKDEAGWAFSTTSAATAVGRLMDLVSGDCYHRDLLDLLKSPFVFGDRPREGRRALVWGLEQCVRRASVVAGFENFRAAARQFGTPQMCALLDAVGAALDAFGRGRRPLGNWIAALQAALRAIGAVQAFERDAAGTQLVALLEGLRRDVAGAGDATSFADFRRWLARVLERSTFRDPGIESPVVFTHLAAAAQRRFDACVLAGCDAAHLPGAEGAAVFFNQGVRAELGLPTRLGDIAQLELDLAILLADAGDALVTWQRSAAGEGNLLSPVFERLRAVSRLAWQDELVDRALGDLAGAARVLPPGPPALPPPTLQPAPRVAPELVPVTLSASSYNALVRCPYQFHARYLLGLGTVDDVEETLDKRDYGKRLHRILAQFHQRHPVVSEIDEALALRELVATSDDVFRDALARDYLAAGWLVTWKTLAPEYLRWQRAREREGWRWQVAEACKRLDLTTPAGYRFALIGRLDRVDAGAGGTAVIDYKTSARAELSKRVQDPAEDVQLAIYTLLWEGAVAQALYVVFDREGVKELPVGDDIGAIAAACRDRLATLLDAIRAGAPLVANGSEAACRYCDMQGLCRRAHWP